MRFLLATLIAFRLVPAEHIGIQDPAPTHITPHARVYVPPNDFGMALSAAILKKEVPIIVVTDSSKADFFVQTVASSTKESGGERAAKVIMLGAFAGSGKHFDASVSITNRDGAVVFAHNSKKENFQSAAENIAKEIKKHVENH